ncbi:hypothetical protein MCOR25_003798 [Pyricularia grisea]|nr:hypothetical protein MCOR25_003798 [Pyricularia grisea]
MMAFYLSKSPLRSHVYTSRMRLSLCRKFSEAVSIAKDGLVYPTVKSSMSNGAVMMPNTFTMQEIIRISMDEVLDLQDEGKHVETPYVFTIRKGTSVPERLILIHEAIARFSLQPSCAMSLKGQPQT